MPLCADPAGGETTEGGDNARVKSGLGAIVGGSYMGPSEARLVGEDAAG
jgi:hypothetical protein